MAVDKNQLDEEAALSLRFYKIVLSWDYLRLLKESDRKKGKGDDDNAALILKKAKNSYKDVQDYLATFEPLLFEEVKAQIVQGKKDDDEEQEIHWMKAVTVGCSEVDGFHFPMISCSDVESISQNDLLLLSNKEFGDGKRLPTAYAFALVEDRRPDKIRLRMHLSGEVKQLNTQETEACSRLLSMRPLVTENAKLLHVLKICSLSTIAREYVALRSVSSLPFKDLILSASDSNSSTEDHAWKISKPLKEFLESNHNKSQLDAINAGLSRKSFVLIQGPPGTGKTQTILGILSAILHATPARVHSNRVKLSGVKRGPELSMADKYVHEHTYPVNICEYGLIDALNKKRTCVDVYMLPFKLYMMKDPTSPFLSGWMEIRGGRWSTLLDFIGSDQLVSPILPILLLDTCIQQQQETQCVPTKWGLGKVRCTQSIPLPSKEVERLFPIDPGSR
ncbi:putative helicase MAGATAMA 3 [Capsicum annuum]|nr:putative helicase MAGATAMA 3 [Capsicum annuum]